MAGVLHPLLGWVPYLLSSLLALSPCQAVLLAAWHFVFLTGTQKCIEEKGNTQKISVSLTIVTSLSANLKTFIEKWLMNIITDLVLFHSFGGINDIFFFPEANAQSSIWNSWSLASNEWSASNQVKYLLVHLSYRPLSWTLEGWTYQWQSVSCDSCISSWNCLCSCD